MTDPRVASLRELAQVVVVANTPNYIVKHFLRSPILTEVQEKGWEEVHLLLGNVARKHEKSYEDLASAYLCIIAMNQIDYARAGRSIEPEVLASLPWAAEVHEAFRSRYIPTTLVSFWGVPPLCALDTQSRNQTLEVTVKGLKG